MRTMKNRKEENYFIFARLTRKTKRKKKIKQGKKISEKRKEKRKKS